MNETKLKLPFCYSIYGVITCQMFGINAAICFANGYTTLSGFLVVLWATTTAHWWKLQKGGFIRNLDIAVALCTIVRITFYDGPNMFNQNEPKWWLIYVESSCLIFVINEFWFSCITLDQTSYVLANTLVHLLVLHILPNLVCMSLVISSTIAPHDDAATAIR
jgi:hypothetical protein